MQSLGAVGRFVLVAIVLTVTASSAFAARVELNDGFMVTPNADVTVTGSATLISALNLNRSTLNCTNTHATVHVRWGSSAVTASTGQQLRAGNAVEIRNTGAVYMISEGANVTVSCTEEIR